MLKILLPCLLLLSSGCASVAYYAQSVHGQWQIMAKSQSIENLLADEQTPEILTQKLALATAIREFASRELALPDNDSYRYYADLQRDYVVWNVFAAPELSLQGREWCYLFVGCLGYRGYFSRARAFTFAGELDRQGLDTWVGGVTAYSTLGWFADPVLNTMLSRDTDYLVKVILHELAHQKIYIENDTAFNEAFAETVALEGLRRWYEQLDDAAGYREFLQKQQHEEQFVRLVLHYRDKLESVYASDMTRQEKLARKQQLLRAMAEDYRQMRPGWGNDDRYDNWFAGDLNNASLLAVSTYRLYVPVLMNKLRQLGGNMPSFYTFVEKLGQCSRAERKAFLESGSPGMTC